MGDPIVLYVVVAVGAFAAYLLVSELLVNYLTGGQKDIVRRAVAVAVSALVITVLFEQHTHSRTHVIEQVAEYQACVKDPACASQLKQAEEDHEER